MSNLRQYYNSINGLQEVFQQWDKPNIDNHPVDLLKQEIDELLNNFPNIVPPFDPQKYFSHSYEDSKPYYSCAGIKAYLSAVSGRLKAAIDKPQADSKNQEKKDKKLASSKKPTTLNPSGSKDIWASIEEDYDLSKRAFSRKIRFVKEEFSRHILFRDVEQAYILANSGFSKPAVILAGSVIEELLRQYLNYKKIKPGRDTFDEYIRICQDNGLLKDAIHRLTDSVRHFRNIVHLAKEKNKKHTISKATAKGAVSSIFTITNDFD